MLCRQSCFCRRVEGLNINKLPQADIPVVSFAVTSNQIKSSPSKHSTLSSQADTQDLFSFWCNNKKESVFEWLLSSGQKFRNGTELSGKDGVLAPMLKRLLEAAMEGEMDGHLKETKVPNRRNGKMGKKLKIGYGTIDVNTPRDRNSSFEPEILPKRQTTLGASLDHKVISLYGIGMSYSDICAHLEEIYTVTTSPATSSTITDRVIKEVNAWQGRPLESVYPFVRMRHTTK